ncbi:MAG: META domain-containing protein [Muribaculaceae bacterium]|nr:META domain-containing protein [Muribaculaceae bacterium]
MKLNLVVMTLAAASMTLTSCSVVEKILGKNEPKPQPAPEVVVNAPVIEKTTEDNKKKEEVERKALYQKPTTEELCGGQWIIESVGEYVIEEEENGPYVNFDNTGRFYAFDGCNVLNGDYVLRPDGTLVFDNPLSTMKYCGEIEYAPLVATIFREAVVVDCQRIGQDTYLYLKNEKGKTKATLRRHNMEFLNGNWQITSIEGDKIDDDQANIFIDIAELKVHGNTGCNFFNGQLYIDPMRSNAIDFSNMIVTLMACHKGDQERRMLVALEETVTAISGKNDDTVLLLGKDNKELLTLKRIPVEK